MNLQTLKYDIQIVPVCMTHERIFDAKMLSADVESGIFQPGRSIIGILRQIFGYRRGKLG